MFWVAKVAILKPNIKRMLPLSQTQKVPNNNIYAFFLYNCVYHPQLTYWKYYDYIAPNIQLWLITYLYIYNIRSYYIWDANILRYLYVLYSITYYEIWD